MTIHTADDGHRYEIKGETVGQGEFGPIIRMTASPVELPCDSEPHGEDAAHPAVMAMIDQERAIAMGSRLRTADDAPYSPGEGHIDDWPHRMRRQQAAHATRLAESAVREFCAAFGIPVPADLKRASAAILALQFNRGT